MRRCTDWKRQEPGRGDGPWDERKKEENPISQAEQDALEQKPVEGRYLGKRIREEYCLVTP